MIKVEFVLRGYTDGAQFDATKWFEQATVEELLALDALGWSSGFEAPLPIPLLDILTFFRNKPGFEQVGMLLRDVCPGYTKWGEGTRRAAMVQIDSYAALAWLAEKRPILLERFEQMRPMRAG